MFRAVVNSLLSIAFPQQCHVCGGLVEDSACGVACSSCWDATRIFSSGSPSCGKCGAPLSAVRDTRGSISCHECEGHLYDTAVSGGAYEKALAASVLELKKTPNIPSRAARILLSAYEGIEARPIDLLLPVPLSPKRRAERGFNQAEIIARHLSINSGVPLDTFTLQRVKHTPMHRAAMDRKAREQTVRNAFKIARPKLIEGRSILLVDDIFTTGATASHCAKELKRHGAASVNVITLARAVRSAL